MDREQVALDYLENTTPSLTALAQSIWDHPEIGLMENHAAGLIAGELERNGFSVTREAAGLPTAFIASWGTGGPTIGILGEYDALPGLSQKVAPIREPAEAGAPGHACGHNLLGTASMGAALAAKHAMEQCQIPGTIRYHGCPAEETLIGKVFMARAGVFDDIDAMLSWHPSCLNTAKRTINTALNSFKVNYHGIAAHAAGSPEEGRSALDGIELMDVGVNFLREHIIQEARIHYTITHGGQAPNIVPEFAQAWYYVRAPRRDQVEDIYARVLDIARGAALMSGTSHDIEFITGCYDTLINTVVSEVLQKKMEKIGPPPFADEDRALAKSLQGTFPEGSIDRVLDRIDTTREAVGDLLCEKVVGPIGVGKMMGGSTDVGDVSYIVPTAEITTCCWPIGTPGHSWQIVASSGSSIGAKGMMLAAKTLALAALKLETAPDILAAARAEFEAATRNKEYISPIPDDVDLQLPQTEK